MPELEAVADPAELGATPSAFGHRLPLSVGLCWIALFEQRLFAWLANSLDGDPHRVRRNPRRTVPGHRAGGGGARTDVCAHGWPDRLSFRQRGVEATVECISQFFCANCSYSGG
jgi:hypothetical protein